MRKGQWAIGSGRRFVFLVMVCCGIAGLAALLSSRSSPGLASLSSSASSARSAADYDISGFCLTCTDKQHECTTEVIGNDGQTRYKRLCCELEEECGSYRTEGERWASPYCRPACHWTDYGRYHIDNYNPTEQCCSPEFGVLQKYPIMYIGQCKHPVPRPGAKPEPNGCGTKDKPVNPTDSEKTADGTIGGKANFTSLCNDHDVCYDTCNSDKNACDAKLLDGMNKKCDATYAAGTKLNTHCHAMAKNWFYAGVQTIFGSGAYDDAQQRVCQCCS